jgi:hypothetical protein
VWLGRGVAIAVVYAVRAVRKGEERREYLVDVIEMLVFCGSVCRRGRCKHVKVEGATLTHSA